MEDSKGGTTTYAYDPLDQQMTIQFSGDGAVSREDQTWTPDSQLAAVKRYSDLAATTLVGESDYTYDADGRTTNI